LYGVNVQATLCSYVEADDGTHGGKYVRLSVCLSVYLCGSVCLSCATDCRLYHVYVSMVLSGDTKMYCMSSGTLNSTIPYLGIHCSSHKH